MKLYQIKIGEKVSYINSPINFMRNGVVIGKDEINNRVFIDWPNHGTSSIHISNLCLNN